VSDDGKLDSARAQQRALVALARPISRPRGPHQDIGDGDPCPVHGSKMYVYGQRQYCPDRGHEGHGDVPATRAFYPLYMKGM
jgi:hypothetical protein